MQKLFTHVFEDPVWKLIPSSDETPSWVIESRTFPQRLSYYYVTLHSPPTKLALDLPWSSGIEIVLGETVIFHGFAQQDLPFHQGIKVVDGKTGKLFWEEDFLIYEFAQETTLWAKVQSRPETTIALSLFSGNELPDISLKTPVEEQRETLSFSQEHEHFPDILAFIQAYTSHMPVKMVEYLETDQYILLSYFISKNKFLDNYLLLTNSKGEVLLHELLTSELKGIIKGSFHLFNGLLSFVQNKNKLVVHQLE